jgi:hypothetical protein
MPTTPQRPTPPGVLADVARHVVLPSGIVSTGWPAVRDKCRDLGVEFDPWQDGAGQVILSKRADGAYACAIGGVVISIPRQVGKTFLMGAIVFALCLLNPGLTVIWTAHHTTTSNQTFQSMLGFCKRKKVAPHILRPLMDPMTVEFLNGSVIMFGARERGFGRGLSAVGVLVFDEGQILTEKAASDMVPTTNTVANALIIYTGTPPKPTDPSEVFTNRRTEALAGDSDDMAYIEFSADPDAKLLDRKQWRRANPSYPKRTNDAAMLRMKKNLTSDASFKREALGIWDDESGEGEIPRWIELADKHSTIATNARWALAVSPLEKGPQWSCFAVVGRRDDGRLHVEALDHRAGTWWVTARAKQIYDERGIALCVRKTGAEGALISGLREAGVEVEELSVVDFAQGTGQFIAAAGFDDEGIPQMHHLDDPDLNRAVKAAKRRTSANGSSTWDELRSAREITAVVAATCALARVPVVVGGEWAGSFTDLDEFAEE